MTTEALDVEGLLAEPADGAEAGEPGIAPGTVMGHVHLRVSDLAAAEALLPRRARASTSPRYGRAASFLSRNGYHHHIGLNTWESLGAPPPPAGALGLDRYELVLPDEDERDAAAATRGRDRRPGAHARRRARHRPVREPRAPRRTRRRG